MRRLNKYYVSRHRNINFFQATYGGHCYPAGMKVVVLLLILYVLCVHSAPELTRRVPNPGSPNELTLVCRDDSTGNAFPNADFWLNSTSTLLTDILSRYDLRSNSGEIDFTINPDLEGSFYCGSVSNGRSSNALELTGKTCNC